MNRDIYPASEKDIRSAVSLVYKTFPGVHIVDCEEVVGPDDFLDAFHVNDGGREKWSRHVAQYVLAEMQSATSP
jgi:hypothetical protein